MHSSRFSVCGAEMSTNVIAAQSRGSYEAML